MIIKNLIWNKFDFKQSLFNICSESNHIIYLNFQPVSNINMKMWYGIRGISSDIILKSVNGINGNRLEWKMIIAKPYSLLVCIVPFGWSVGFVTFSAALPRKIYYIFNKSAFWEFDEIQKISSREHCTWYTCLSLRFGIGL